MKNNNRGYGARRASIFLATLIAALVLAGCTTPASVQSNATLTPATKVTRDLLHLPSPKGKVVAAVYGLRDQTGQYKMAPDSSFSTEVTQGAASFLIKALNDSGWFIPVERENLQDLLTERKIMRALETPEDKNQPIAKIGALLPASVIIEGGVVAYDSNVKTGGVGAAYLGLRASQQYRVDQVTVNLRTVDIRGGQILNNVLVTKTIYSYEVAAGVFRFIGYKDLLQAEAGIANNEPQQLCVKEALESAVVHLIAMGLQRNNWTLRDAKDWQNPILQRYFRENLEYEQGDEEDAGKLAAMVPGAEQADDKR